jgi:hypothetical protein
MDSITAYNDHLILYVLIVLLYVFHIIVFIIIIYLLLKYTLGKNKNLKSSIKILNDEKEYIKDNKLNTRYVGKLERKLNISKMIQITEKLKILKGHQLNKILEFLIRNKVIKIIKVITYIYHKPEIFLMLCVPHEYYNLITIDLIIEMLKDIKMIDISIDDIIKCNYVKIIKCNYVKIIKCNYVPENNDTSKIISNVNTIIETIGDNLEIVTGRILEAIASESQELSGTNLGSNQELSAGTSLELTTRESIGSSAGSSDEEKGYSADTEKDNKIEYSRYNSHLRINTNVGSNANIGSDTDIGSNETSNPEYRLSQDSLYNDPDRELYESQNPLSGPSYSEYLALQREVNEWSDMSSNESGLGRHDLYNPANRHILLIPPISEDRIYQNVVSLKYSLSRVDPLISESEQIYKI